MAHSETAASYVSESGFEVQIPLRVVEPSIPLWSVNGYQTCFGRIITDASTGKPLRDIVNAK